MTRRLVDGSTGNGAAALNAERPILDRRFGSAARGAHSPEVRNLALAVLLQPVGPDHPVVALARCQALGASVGGPRLLPVDHRNALLGLFVEPPTMHMTVTVTAGPSRPPPVVITTGTATLLLHAGRYNLTAVAVPTLTCRYTVTVPAGDQTGLQLTIGDPPACHNMTPTAEPPQHVSTTVVGRTP